jgi:hypothetical protein
MCQIFLLIQLIASTISQNISLVAITCLPANTRPPSAFGNDFRKRIQNLQASSMLHYHALKDLKESHLLTDVYTVDFEKV